MSKAGVITDVLARKLADWLGPDGIEFFSTLKKDHGTVSPVLKMPIGDELFTLQQVPHPVHLREGMQVRNFLRDQPETLGWEAQEEHVFDNVWMEAVEAALKIAEEPRTCFACGGAVNVYRDEWGTKITCKDPDCTMGKVRSGFNTTTNPSAWNYLSLSRDLMDLANMYSKAYVGCETIDFETAMSQLGRVARQMKIEHAKLKRG